MRADTRLKILGLIIISLSVCLCLTCSSREMSGAMLLNSSETVIVLQNSNSTTSSLSFEVHPMCRPSKV